MMATKDIQEIYYPESDGKPLAETDFHLSAIAYLRETLRHLFRHVPDVYVSGCILFYYVEGQPKFFKVPDVFVVKGVAKGNRRYYQLWKEKNVPATVFEITSNETRAEDQGAKQELYQTLGVKEYFLFDPLDEYLVPRLQGLRLQNGQYVPILPTKDETLYSEELALMLRPSEDLLRVVDPRTGKVFPTLEELADIIAAPKRI